MHPLTQAPIVANVLVFLLEQLLGNALTGWFALRPLSTGGRLPVDPSLACGTLLRRLRADTSPGRPGRRLLDMPVAAGGLALSRFGASAVQLGFIAACLYFFTHHASRKGH